MKNHLIIAVFFTTLFLYNPISIVYAGPSFDYGFQSIGANLVADADIGEAQLGFNVADMGFDVVEGFDQILFTFTNEGPEASSICDIYFDDDVPLLNFVEFQYDLTQEVSFTVGGSPPNLPGGNNINFSSNDSYHSDTPTQPMGINPSESLGILFNISSGYDYNHIIASLNSLENLSMRVGIHVQGFDSGGSEGFVNTPGTPGSHVPEPATMLLLGFGLIGLAGIGRRNRKV